MLTLKGELNVFELKNWRCGIGYMNDSWYAVHYSTHN